MANADRISEVYRGEIWDPAAQQRARARVDWLAGHARGCVLDVGCSQGIASLIAARSGAADLVVGIDNELDRIAYAAADRAAEPSEVAARLAFVGGSGAALPFADDSFDTVLLGEVLEHLDKPDDVLAEVARVLRAGGTVAVTVPFGLSPHHDHRRTFYAADLLDLLSGHLAPTSIDLVDRYLRATATGGHSDAIRRAELLAGVQPVADREVLAVERAELAGRRDARELARRSRELATRSRQLADREREVARLRRALSRAEVRLEAAGRRQRELAFQRDTFRWQLAGLKRRRSLRALVAVRRALADPRTLLTLPATLARVLVGPAPPAAPRPQRLSAQASQPAAHAAVEQRRGLELQMRMLAPPPPVALRDLRVAAVLDEFSESSFGPACDLVTFRPDNWEAVLTRQPPHLLFVESAWKATGGSWQYQVGTYHHAEAVGLPHLRALVAWCRQRGIPAVFWNKEDPVHFGTFMQAAQLFDVVLTTDADCVARYRALPHVRARVVDALPFAAQPALHHPVSLVPRERICAFGGTYYRTRHRERREQLEVLLDAARAPGLVIFDRTFGQASDSVGFPERFAPHIQGGLPYTEMVEAYRRYRVFLNANSVVASPTMFSRRVFELLACGTPVVSTRSAGMERLFGDIVLAVDDEAGARDAVTRLLADDADWHARSAAGLRRVHGEHTYAHRLATLVGHAGFDIPAYGDERVAVLLLDGPASARAVDAIAAQTHRPHELLLGTDRDVAHPDVTTVAQSPDRSRAERLAELAATTDAPWVLVADPDRDLGLDDLADLAVARRWTTADVIGTAAHAVPAHRYVDRVVPGGALVRRELVADHGWDDADAASQARLAALGATFYAARA